MITPALHPQESHRLAELRRYGILDSPPEPAFDAIAALAATICGTPMAAITFIDEQRQWLKAATGMALGQTTRGDSFCGHTILESSPLVIEDTLLDIRFRDNPFVEGQPNIRFYAGAPLVAPSGAPLGALCVVDKVPRALDEQQTYKLELLARQVVAQLELRRLHDEMKTALAERDKAEQQVRLLHDLSVGIADAEDGVAAMALTVEKLCRFLGWQVAGAWLPDPSGESIHCTDAFYVEHPELEKFRLVSRSLSMPRGLGLPGQALSSAQPVWVNDVSRAPGMPRARVAADLGLVTGAAMPVKVGANVVAVLEFLSTERRDTDPAFLSLVAGVAAELGGAFARKAVHDALRTSEVQFRSVAASAPDAIVIADDQSRIVSWNAAAEKTFGYSCGEATGKSLSLIVPERLREAHERGMQRVLASGQSQLAGRMVELLALRKGGEEFPIEMSIATWQVPGRRFFSGIIRDVTQRKSIEAALKASEEALRHQATHDALTEVPNRRAVLDAAERELARARRVGSSVAVALIDLDHFKNVNDVHGHGAGDHVLKEAARRMSSSVRPYDVFGRYGGEEFIVFLPGCNATDAVSIAERVRENLGASPIATPQAELHVTCSIGVAVWAAETLEELVRRADESLYRAKAAGRNCVSLWRGDTVQEQQTA